MPLNPREVLRWLRMPWARNPVDEQLDDQLSVLPRLVNVGLVGVYDRSGKLRSGILPFTTVQEFPVVSVALEPTEVFRDERFFDLDTWDHNDRMVINVVPKSDVGIGEITIAVASGESGGAPSPVVMSLHGRYGTGDGGELELSNSTECETDQTAQFIFSGLRGLRQVIVLITNGNIGALTFDVSIRAL